MLIECRLCREEKPEQDGDLLRTDDGRVISFECSSCLENEIARQATQPLPFFTPANG
jgi:hypothetical protein